MQQWPFSRTVSPSKQIGTYAPGSTLNRCNVQELLQEHTLRFPSGLPVLLMFARCHSTMVVVANEEPPGGTRSANV